MYRVTVSLQAPKGPVFRVISRRAEATGKTFEEMKKFYMDQIPSTLCHPYEVAKAALFLVSDDSSGVTAQHFCVSGGIEVL